MNDAGHAAGNWSVFRAPHSALVDVGLACLGAGEQSGAFPSFFNRTLDSHALVIVSEGSGKIWGPGGVRTSVRVDSPSYFWVPPGVSHGYGPTASGWVEHWVLLSGATTSAFAQLGVLVNGTALTPRPLREKHLTQMFAQLRASLQLEGPAGDLGASAASLQIIAQLRPKERAAEDTVIRTLREQAFQPLTLSMQAKALSISQDEMYRRVLSGTGLSPKGFIIHQRLQRAQGLLAETDLPIRYVARMSGYDDAAYFSRFFSKRVGLSPSAFRSQQRRGRTGTQR